MSHTLLDVSSCNLLCVQGAFYGLMIGTVTGLIRLILETSYPSPKCSEDTRPDILKNFHYLYFCTCLFVLSLLTIVVVSLLTDPIDPKYVS